MQTQLNTNKYPLDKSMDQAEVVNPVQPVSMENVKFQKHALQTEGLPSPEEVFNIKRIGIEELFLLVLGPSVIALGISIGSNVWLQTPLIFSEFGFKGLGWVLLVSALLQVFYNVELARYTIATGEAPLTAFSRMRLGYFLWVPLALVCLFLAFFLGDWVVEAGAGIFALFTGRPHLVEELESVRLLGIGMLIVWFIILLVGRKVERTLEAIHAIYLPYIILGLVLITLAVVPFSFWGETLGSIIIPSLPPHGTELSLLGQLARFTGLSFGLNFIFISYYRDKGYGMGHKAGYISGAIRGEKVDFSLNRKRFSENDINTLNWKRWFRYLVIDQWGIYFPILLIGSILPAMLVTYLAKQPGAAIPSQSSIITYAAQELGKKYGTLLSGWTLISGFIILFSTQMVILELLARSLTDAAFTMNARLRQFVRNDPRWIYYPSLIGFIILLSIIIHLDITSQLRNITAAIANLGAVIFPLVMIFLNRKLPKPARISSWSYIVLIAYTIFFGILFVNSVIVQLTGSPLFRF